MAFSVQAGSPISTTSWDANPRMVKLQDRRTADGRQSDGFVPLTLGA